MFMPLPGRFGRPAKMLPSPFRQDEDAWRLDVIPIAQDLDAGEYGLLDPRLGEEAELPGEGMLSLASRQPEREGLPIPALKPPPPFRLDDADRQAMIDRLIAREGGYVNNPNDPGGPTNYGVTQVAIDDYNRLMALEGGTQLQKTPAAISRAEAEAIHRKTLSAYRFDRIQDSLLREQVFDMATNHGPAQAVLLLQEVLGGNGYPVAVDGVLGSETRNAINELTRDPEVKRRINNDLARRREDFYRTLIQRDPASVDFEDGWLRRARSFLLLPPPY